MERLLLKAVTTAATDKGEFTAVISTATIDREKDIVDPEGFVRALHKWVPLSKKVPLAWNHSGRPEDQIGYIDPATVRVKGNEVVASGKVDLDTPNGAHAWRCVKAGTLGFSFGYLVPAGGSTKRAGGGRHITELDVFEVTATPTPMNGDTRVLDYKAIKGHADVGPHARDKLKYLIRYYMSKPHPFTECVHDNTKRFGPDGADKVCATLKDVGLGTTHWRNQHGKAVSDVLGAPVDDAPTDADLENMCQALLDSSDGNVDGLMAMWMDHMHSNGDGPTAPAKALSAAELRRKADKVALDAATGDTTADASEDEDDPAELLGGMISTAQDFIDDEDDPADVAVMRQIMDLLLKLQAGEANEPPSKSTNLSQDVKDKHAVKAQRTLDKQQSADETGQERKHARSVDSLRRLADAVALDFVSDGESRKKPPRQQEAPQPTPELDLKELRRRSREEMLIALSGVKEP